MTKHSTINHGEGNPEAARNFNDAETKFVRSARGQKKIRGGAAIAPAEAAAVAGADRAGAAHSKGEDRPDPPVPARGP